MTPKRSHRERRTAIRIPFRRISRYEIPLLPTVHRPRTRKPLRGTILNISQGGFCLQGTLVLKKQTVLRVFIPIDNLSVQAPTLAEVVWTKKEGRGLKYRTGLRFIL